MGLSNGIHLRNPVMGVAHVETNQQTTVLVWRRQVRAPVEPGQTPPLLCGSHALSAALCPLLILQLLSDAMLDNNELCRAFTAALTADVVRKAQDREGAKGKGAALHALQVDQLMNARYEASYLGSSTAFLCAPPSFPTRHANCNRYASILQAMLSGASHVGDDDKVRRGPTTTGGSWR